MKRIFTWIVFAGVVGMPYTSMAIERTVNQNVQGTVSVTPLQQQPNDAVTYRVARDSDGTTVILDTVPQGATAFVAENVPKGLDVRTETFVGYIVGLSEDPLAKVAAPFEESIVARFESDAVSLTGVVEAAKRQKIIRDRDTFAVGVRVREQAAVAAQRNIITAAQSKAVSAVRSVAPNARVTNTFTKSFNGFVVRDIPQDAVEAIRKKGYTVWGNATVKALLDASVPLIGATEAWARDADGGACAKSGKPCMTGKGVKVGIIDTGIDYTHPDLGGCLGTTCKVFGGYDFVNNDSDPMDDHGHGTHVAATVAGVHDSNANGRRDSGELWGVAPQATLYGIKVLDSGGSGSWGNVLAGIEYAADPDGNGDFSNRLDVVNLSLGGSGNPDDPLAQAIDTIATLGVIPVVAAGNSGSEQFTVMSPGVAALAITVGATEKPQLPASDELIAWFSSRGPVRWTNANGAVYQLSKPDIVAPGVAICAAEYDSWLSDRRCVDGSHIAISGTSMATPHVTGVAALIRQKNPYITTQKTKSLIMGTSKDITVGGAANETLAPTVQGAGRVNARAALLASSSFPIVTLQPTGVVKNGAVGIRGKVYSSSKENKSEIWYGRIESSGLTSWQLANVNIGNGESFYYKFDVRGLYDGEYAVKVVVINSATGAHSVGYTSFAVDKFSLVEPQGSDVLGGNDTITFRTKREQWATGTERFFYAPWFGTSTENIYLPGKTLNPRGLPTGKYLLGVEFTHDGITEIEKVLVHIDQSLKAGWPVRIPYKKFPCPWDSREVCAYWSGFLEPILADINGDGRDEIITYNAGNPPELLVYRSDGRLLWKKPIGGNLSLPIVGNFDSDERRKEIAVISPNFFSGYGALYVFSYDGKPLRGWPASVQLPYDGFHYTMASADLDRNGIDEIIVKGSSGNENNPETKRRMVIVGQRGVIQNTILLGGKNLFSDLEGYPAFGNFDNDPDLEIVIADPSPNAGWTWSGSEWIINNEGIIHVYNADGSEVSGWPQTTQGIIFASPSVGDVNADGRDDIIVGLMYTSNTFPDPNFGGVYVFNRDGTVMDGWPRERGYNFWSTPSLADVDGDKKLEIGISRLGFSTYIFKHDGSLVSGWPQQTGWNDYYSSAFADLDGDQIPELVTTAGSWSPNFGVNGGVYAWRTDGSAVAGFPRVTEVDAQAFASVSDIDHDGIMDIAASSDWDFDWNRMKFKMRGSLYMWSLGTRYDRRAQPWPTFHRNAGRDGRHPLLSLPQESRIPGQSFMGVLIEPFLRLFNL